MVEVAGEELGQPRRQLDRRRRGQTEEVRHERDLAHLRRRGIGQLGAAVADIDVPEPGEGVDVALAVGVPEEDIFAAHHDQRAVVAQRAQVRDRVEEMRLVLRDELGGVPCLRDGHVPSSRAPIAPLAIP